VDISLLNRLNKLGHTSRKGDKPFVDLSNGHVSRGYCLTFAMELLSRSNQDP